MTSTKDLFDLTGKRAIITGGGTGLGLYFARALAEAGADTVLCGRKVERCVEAAQEIEAATATRSLGLRCDVRDRDEVDAVVETTVAELGGVDILVNNAGTSWGAPAADFPIEGWDKVIGVNLTGTFHFSQSAGRHMIAAGTGGKIVNLSSVMALQAQPPHLADALAYNASKGGVISFTRDLAVKWARYGIGVNAIAPGWFPTDMSQVVLDRNRDEYLNRIPFGRFGDEDDLKGVVVFLASDASQYITGQTLAVDGGQSVN